MTTSKEQGIFITTFGCRLNTYESEIMRQHARAYREKTGQEKKLVIINSCTVTNEAERQTRQAIRRAKSKHPEAKILVTGCAAERAPDSFINMPEVDYVVGNAAKTKPDLFDRLEKTPVILDVLDNLEAETVPLNDGFEGRPRAFVQVQMGCDYSCTFCVVTQTRGQSRSVPLEAIADQIKMLRQKGYNEIGLTGVDITSYGKDQTSGINFTQMIRRILGMFPDLGRVRLSSLDPAALDDDFFDLFAKEPRLAPYLHLSMQAGDDMILKRMKRRHNVADLRALCAKAKAARADATLGADLIAGFPTETEEMFQNTANLIRELGIIWTHVFPYSAREGTAAARMPQIDGGIRKNRALILRKLGEEALSGYLKSLEGQKREILIEKKGVGKEPGFAEVHLDEKISVEEAPIGQIIPVRIIGREDTYLKGELIK